MNQQDYEQALEITCVPGFIFPTGMVVLIPHGRDDQRAVTAPEVFDPNDWERCVAIRTGAKLNQVFFADESGTTSSQLAIPDLDSAATQALLGVMADAPLCPVCGGHGRMANIDAAAMGWTR